MKNSILKFGLYSALFLMGVNLVILAIMGIPEPEEYNLGEVIGYSTILLSLVFVFFGMKNFRDEVNQGNLKFWNGLLIGLGIVAIPSLAFAIYNYVYAEVLDPEFLQKYMNYSLQKAEASMTATEFSQYKASLEANKELYSNTLFQSVVMFLTVFVIGFVVSFLSALILKR